MTAPKQGPRLERLEAREVPAAIVGALDPSFGTGGKETLARGFQTVHGEATDAQGRTVVVGDTAGSGGGDVLIARFNKDGTPDPTFNNNTGGVALDFGGAFDTANAVAIDPAGNITVVGSTRPIGLNPGPIQATVVRLDPTGKLAAGFGTNGTETLASPTQNAALNAVTLDPSGNVVVAGSGYDAVGLAFFITGRLNPATGAVDPAFNGGKLQKIAIHPVSDDSANAVVVDPSGNIVLAGTSNFKGNVEAAVVRLLPGGQALDGTFAGTGVLTFNAPGSTADLVRAVALDPSGNIDLAMDSGPTGKLAVARVNPGGALDTAFGTGGLFVSPLGGVTGSPAAAGIVIAPSGRITVAGTVSTGGPTGLDFAVVQLQANGTLDPGFNVQSTTPGIALIDFAGHDDVARGLSRTLDGKLVVAGVDLNTNNLDLARLFGTLGIGRAVVASGTTDGSAVLFPQAATNPGFLDTAGIPLSPFGTVSADVRTAVADVNGDGVDDIAAVTGPGSAVRFAVLDGRDHTTYIVPPTDPFGDPAFTLGAFVAAGDIDGDGRADIVITPDQGGGPNVVIYSVKADGTLAAPKSFFALGNPSFRGGARVAVGDINGDGRADVAVGAGFLGGPNVEIHDGLALAGGDFTSLVLPGFFAFTGGDATTLRNGVFLAAGDVNGDGFSDLVIGGGPGGGPRVLVLDGQKLANKDIFGAYDAPVANFFFGNGSDRGGVRVATVDADGDGKADVAVGSGENLPSLVRVYFGRSINGRGEPAVFQDLDPYGTTLSAGVFVG